MLYYAVHALELDGGVMVTGSHNPPADNGFKLMRGTAGFFGADIAALGTRAARGDWSSGDGASGDTDVRSAYVERLLRDYRARGGLKVGWDAGNGAAGEVLVRLAHRLPGSHTLLNAEIDGTFPAHHPDPTVAANLRQLRGTVADFGLDIGIAFDGDGDRIGVVDGEGAIVWADQLLALFAREVLAEHPGATVIADVKSSRVLFDEVARLGGAPLMWRTGHSPIKAKMAEVKAPLAGEQAAHLFFADRYYGFDDALYAAVRLLDLVVRSGRSLAALRAELPATFNTPELRFPCPGGAQVRRGRGGQIAAVGEGRRRQRDRRRPGIVARRLVAAARLQHPGRAGRARGSRQRGGPRTAQGRARRAAPGQRHRAAAVPLGRSRPGAGPAPI